MSRLIVSLTVFACCAASAFAEMAEVKGVVGEKFAKLLERRLFSEQARGDVYAETTNAFRTCYDDTRSDPHGYADYSHRPGKGLWQGEYWGKMMLSAAKAIEYGAPAEFREWTRTAALAFIRDWQRPNGYIGTYRDEDFLGGPDGKGGEVFCWNVWSRKYTIWALVELDRVLGEPKFTAAAARVADHLIAQLKRLDRRLIDTGYFAGLPSASILKPMLLLYKRTDNLKYLDFCREVVKDLDRTDGYRPNLVANAFTAKPIHEWYPEPMIWAKAYEMMSSYEGLVEYARVTGERRPLEAALRAADKIAANEVNVLGGAGYHDHFANAAHRANAVTEVCDVIHWMFLERELYLEDRDVRRLDAFEYAMFNAFSAGVYRDALWGAHDVRSHGRRQCTAPFEVEMHYHFCCIANAPRGFAAYAETVATESKKGEAELNFYTGGKSKACGVEFEVSGGYPISNRVTVKAKPSGSRRVAFRVPGWCAKMTVDGVEAKGPRHVVDIEGERTFVLEFDMSPVVHDRSTALQEEDRYSRPFFEEIGYCPESTFSALEEMRAYVTRGPLLLARCRAAGLRDGEVFSSATVNGRGFKASCATGPDRGTWGSWVLTLENGKERFVFPVTDYATAADYDDPRNAFSIWF